MNTPDNEKVIACLQNELDFEIMMYFIMYRELSLSRLEELVPHKSRPTIYRHIQNLLDAEIIVEAREEKVRSNIKAKYYQLTPTALSRMPQVTPEQLAEMSEKEKSKLYIEIREALYPSIKFIQQSLDSLENYLRLLQPHPEKELLTEFDKQDFHLTFNFLTEKQYRLFLDEYTKFMQAFIPQLLEEEQKNPSAEKSYLFSMSILPIRKIFDRIMLEGKEDG